MARIVKHSEHPLWMYKAFLLVAAAISIVLTIRKQLNDRKKATA